MRRKVFAPVVVLVLALGAGVAFAATQTSSSGGTNVCVNDTNGIVRVFDTCREGEHPLTIGGGGGLQVSNKRTFSVPWGETGGTTVLPLTGVSISGRCEVATIPDMGDVGLARIRFDAATGQTMDLFYSGQSNPIGLTSSVTFPLSNGGGPVIASNSSTTAIVASNAATATVTLGGYVDTTARTCIYMWQAYEAPN